MNNIAKYFLIIFTLFFSIPSYADQSCNYVYNPNNGLYDIQYCISGVNFSNFYLSVQETQNQTQWCWAASISMLFKYNGFNIDQETIVNEAYGGLVNLPASGYTLASGLNRNWIDKSGKTFSARIRGLVDLDAGIINMNNNQIISELSDGRPMIIGASGHAMVLTEVGYYLDSFGNLLGWEYAGVFDPWPGKGARSLTSQEFTLAGNYDVNGYPGTMRFLASVNILPIFTDTSSDIDESSSSSGGTFSYIFNLFILILVNYRNNKGVKADI